MFDVEFSQTAEKQLLKLDKDMQKRVINSLERIRIRPHPHLKKLIGSPYFRLRVDDFRIIVDIRDGKLIIFVIEVGHKKNIYK